MCGTNNNGTTSDTLIPGSWIGSPHRYRIAWTAASIIFSIHGVVVHNELTAIGSSMRIVASDFSSGGANLMIDWVRLSPFATNGVFTSKRFNAGDPSTWLSLTKDASVPLGTTVSLETRTGNTAVPDGSWSLWQPVLGAAITSPAGQYLQYRATLATSSDLLSPELQDVTIAYGPVLGTTAAAVSVSGRVLDQFGRPVPGCMLPLPIPEETFDVPEQVSSAITASMELLQEILIFLWFLARVIRHRQDWLMSWTNCMGMT